MKETRPMSRVNSREVEVALDAIETGLIVLDPHARISAWNSWMVSAAGISAEAAHGRQLHELFPSTARSRLATAVTEALQIGTPSILTHSLHHCIFPLKTRSGRTLVHDVLVRSTDGEPPACLIQVNDVTVATERDRVLRQRQNARYDAVVEGAPDAILTLDTDGVIQFANPAAAREFEYPRNDLLGQPGTLLFGDQEAWNTAWRTLVAGDALRRPIELVARRKDGTLSYVEMSAARWSAESRVFVTAILRDVNERRAAEAALRSLNQTLERRVAERTADRDRMWRLSTDVMLVARLDGYINAVNPAWTKLLAWDEAELQGADLRDFIVPADVPKLDTALQNLATTPAPIVFELRVRTATGASRWIAWSAAVADDLLHAVGRDVTEQREAEHALSEAEAALRQAQKMEAIGQLTGGIAHDFNNLLTGIIGSLEILKRRVAAKRYDDVERFIDAAVTSGDRAATLIHRLLAFARRQPLDPRPLNVNRLVQGMSDLLRRSLNEHIQLDLSLGEDIWPTLTDPHQLENALLNLVINGRDAMPDGGRLKVATANVSLTTGDFRGKNAAPPGDYVQITVTDTGVGMSAAVAAQAFDPFFTTKPTGQGTGLGLSMIYGFVTQSRGGVWIDSKVGDGTQVKLHLPRHPIPFADEQPPAPVADVPQGSGEVVLLVEDDPAVRLLISDVLAELGYACLEATDGQAALPIITSDTRLNLLITDVGLPGLNGRQLAEIAKQHRPDLKVLLVTGYAHHAAVRSKFLGPGMDMVIKPFALDTLAVKIRSMIGVD
jgi:PAS domain S-box-containing protein